MMTTLSKISVPKDEPFNCYEVAHVWNPSCKESAIDIFFDTVISSSKVYAPFYLISILTRRKFLTLDVFIKYVRDVQLLGKFDRKASYLAAAVASYIAIKFERKNRRQALALYVTNVASETLFWMLQSRGLVRKIPYGDILLMSISSAVLLLLYRRQKLSGVVPAVLNIMLDKNNDQKKAELCDCLWRHVFDCDSSKQALASGFIAGLSISIYRSPSISVYLFWKAVEALWLQLQEKYPNLNFPQGIELLYSCSTALLITAGTLEAHNVRPEYITFLKQITNNRFGTINRILLDEFSTTQKASTYFPYFFMVSDLEKTSSRYKAILAKLKNSGLMKYLV
ncbi:Transmembrane protein 135 [Nymphon striatum]|nr:Transmembrane protein 135 [Nymphon striatum]